MTADVKAPDYAQQFDVFNKFYQAMASAVNQLPVAQRYKDLVSQNFDQGFMWAREAFTLLIQQQQKAQPVATDETLSPETVVVPDAAGDQ